jgi:polysaccharide export outer membrane protein
VVGAVYHDNSFLFRQGARASQYLNMAGGTRRDADRQHVYIIRASGVTVPNGAANSWFSGVNDRVLLPGDTVVVPQKLDRTSLMRGLRDWSQILGQFGLGAAAITTLTR